MKKQLIMNAATIACAAGALVACGSAYDDERNERPTFVGEIGSIKYDGNTDDLLTAGLGKSGLGAAAAPAFADPLNPSPAELRRNAIFNNYRAIQDVNPNSGYGTLYGPNVDASGAVTSGEGKIPGTEYITYADDGSGTRNVTLMLQVPDNFDVDNPCIITGASSGSRGIYGAIGTSGEWGLKNRCAVAYTDKGTGTGLYTFDDDSVNLRNGTRATRTAAGRNAVFTPNLADAARTAFASAFPNRIAFKHAHSQLNPEQDWGRNTLQAVEFAFYVLNEKYPRTERGGRKLLPFKPERTMVIGSSISNGGGAALLAAEQDRSGLIDGVAVTEPQIQPRVATGYTITQGGRSVGAQGRALFDYSTFAALYQPCIAGSAARCSALAARGLLSGADTAAQIADALARMHAYGWPFDTDILQGAHAGAYVLVAVTYANAYGRFPVADNVCGFSFSNTDALGVPVPFSAAQRAGSFANMNGIPGNAVYEDSVGGARAYDLAVSPSTGAADQALDGFLCLRGLAIGEDPVTGRTLTGVLRQQSDRVRRGNGEVQATGNLNGKPVLMVQGRGDTLVPVNHATRAYLGLNATVEGDRSRLRYIEVTNANHFDAFASALPNAIVPLHLYLFRALDAMQAHLRRGVALPPSQVVRTATRASADTPITVANVPPFLATPRTADAIAVTATTVAVPD